jgi:hypothetical protein
MIKNKRDGSAMNTRMNKRVWITLAVWGMVFLLTVVFSLIIDIFFPAYRGCSLCSLFLFFGGRQWYFAIKQRQAATRSGASLSPWWKHSGVVQAIMWGCFAVLECLAAVPLGSNIFESIFESNLGAFFGMLFALFTLGVCIYEIILKVQHLEPIKPSRRPQ